MESEYNTNTKQVNGLCSSTVLRKGLTIGHGTEDAGQDNRTEDTGQITNKGGGLKQKTEHKRKGDKQRTDHKTCGMTQNRRRTMKYGHGHDTIQDGRTKTEI